MRDTVIIYNSKYGSTKRYAEWIRERTGADLYDLAYFNPALLDQYNCVVFGSPVYMGKIRYARFIRENWKTLVTKRIALFSVTCIPSDDPRQKGMIERSLPLDIRNKLKWFPLRGAFFYGGLNFWDKMLMSEPRIRIWTQWRLKRNQETRARLDRFHSPHDWTNKAAIEPIIAFIYNLRSD